MTIIQLRLPPQVDVVGALHDRSDITRLDQDLLQLTLPGDIIIDVGWYPDRDPHGRYRLIVFRSTPDHSLERQLRSRDVYVIQRSVLRLVAKYLPAISPLRAGNASRLAISLNGTVDMTPALQQLSGGSVARIEGVLT